MYLELEDDFFVWYNILILFENDFRKIKILISYLLL